MEKFPFFEEHALDSVLVNHHRQLQYLHIPVNASSWGKTIFSAAKFSRGKVDHNFKTIIFFRDPIDRWLSGLATWLTYRLPQHTPLQHIRDNQALLDVLFDTVRQDDHTERQCFFIQNIDLENTVCFYLDSSFQHAVSDYFDNILGFDISNFPAEHQTTLEGGKLIPKQYFRSVLESNTNYMKRVKEFFDIDYRLLQRTRFENATKVKCQYYDTDLD